jgi:hypothetical protein
VIETPLIVQVPRQGKLEASLKEAAPHGVPAGAFVVEAGNTDEHGVLEALEVGEVVLSVPSPEALTRDPAAVRHVIADAGPGNAPLVIEIEAAEELTGEELALLVQTAEQSPRPVLVRVVREV